MPSHHAPGLHHPAQRCRPPGCTMNPWLRLVHRQEWNRPPDLRKCRQNCMNGNGSNLSSWNSLHVGSAHYSSGSSSRQITELTFATRVPNTKVQMFGPNPLREKKDQT